MCAELEQMLDEGFQAACLLIEHLNDMGAASCAIPVEIDGLAYEVTARKVANVQLVP